MISIVIVISCKLVSISCKIITIALSFAIIELDFWINNCYNLYLTLKLYIFELVL